MADPHGDLYAMQVRFMAALREPIVGESRSRSELPERPLRLSPDFRRTASDLISPSATLEPVERLELYHRQYWYRLLDSLAEDFPALQAFLGHDPFWRLIEDYLLAHPPATPSLRHVGSQLADFIHAHADSVASPAHAEELARLEYGLCAIIEAAERPPASATELPSARLALQPYLRLFGLRTNADVLWRRGAHGRPMAPASPVSPIPNHWVAIDRKGGRVRVQRLSKTAHAILRAIDETGGLEQALDRVLAMPIVLRRRDLARVERWFAAWTADGWLHAVLPGDA
jgi:hypothetical protein